jgi:hypothetical protein
LPTFDRDLAGRGVTLHLAEFNDHALGVLRRSPAHALLADRIHADIDAALAHRSTARVWTTRA